MKRWLLLIALTIALSLAGAAVAVVPGEHEVSACDTATAVASVPDVLYGDGGTRTGTIPGATDTKTKQVCVTATATDSTTTLPGPTTTVTTTQTVTVAPPPGQVVYGYNFDDGDPVAIPPHWGWGDSNNTLALDTSTFWSAPASGKFTVRAGTYRAELFSSGDGTIANPTVICNRCDSYYNLTYMIPSGFNIKDGAGISHLLQINQESMQGNSSGAILVTLGTKIAGAASQPWLGIVSEGGDQRLFPNGDYYSGSPQWAGSCGQCRPAGWPGAPYYIQGPGTIAAGQWYQVVIHVHWTTDSDGVLEVWLRPKGGTLTKVVDLGPVGSAHGSQFNFPTLEWGYQTSGCGGQLYDGGNIAGLRNCTADEPGQYVGNTENLTVPVTVWEDNFCKATSLDAATGC